MGDAAIAENAFIYSRTDSFICQPAEHDHTNAAVRHAKDKGVIIAMRGHGVMQGIKIKGQHVDHSGGASGAMPINLSLAELDILRLFRRRARNGLLPPRICEIQEALGCRHSAHIPGLVTSLTVKGYLARDFQPVPVRHTLRAVPPATMPQTSFSRETVRR